MRLKLLFFVPRAVLRAVPLAFSIGLAGAALGGCQAIRSLPTSESLLRRPEMAIGSDANFCGKSRDRDSMISAPRLT